MRSNCALELRSLAVALMLAGDCHPTRATENEVGGPRGVGLVMLDLEGLMDIEMAIVSKRSESVREAPASVAVLTAEDIRRSGATSIPEALRFVPGLNVYQHNPGVWSIGVRGFNEVMANKLLVLVDGRSVYSPMFAGVFWDVQDTVLEDIKRIEIIRRPGATVWGANAVNGVINIVTESARETQGTMVSATGGSEIHGMFAVRYGGRLSENLFFRLYGKYFDRDNHRLADGSGSPDGYFQSRGGLRLDWHPSETGHYTLQGELYGGRFDEHVNLFAPGSPPSSVPSDFFGRVNGGHAMAKADMDMGNEAKLRVQAYYDRADRDRGLARKSRETGDLEVQWNQTAGERHYLAMGLGYRVWSDGIDGTATTGVLPAKQTQQLFGVFVQYEIALVSDRLRLTLGSKFEHNDFTGFEVQPGVRLGWNVRTNQLLWASVSRAVRMPSRIDDGARLSVFLPGTPVGTAATVQGSPAFDSEELWAQEIGWRTRLTPELSLDVSAFYNIYDKLRSSYLAAAAFAGTHRVVTRRFGNDFHGESYGFEATATWEVEDWWRVIPGYNFTEIDLRSSRDGIAPDNEELATPHHQVFLRSQMDLPEEVEFDAALRFVDSMGSPALPSFFQLDLRLGWRPLPGLELSIVGQNLLDDQHPEIANTFLFAGRASEVERSVFGKLTWRF